MKILKRAGILLCLLLFFYVPKLIASTEQTYFQFSQNCLEAQQYIKVLKLDKARAILEREHAINPNNVAVNYLEDYIDYYYLITNQQLDELHRLEKNRDLRLARIKKSDPNSPYYLYTQAEINLHWAFSRVFNQEYVSAALEFRSAYQLLENNKKKYPLFKPNDKSLGMLKAVLGSIPENYKWILSVIGMRGNLSEGLKEIKEYLDQKEFPHEQLIEKQSAEFYYTFLLLNFGEKQDCWKFCESVTEDYSTNLLSAYLRAFVGVKCAHNDDALITCAHRPHGNEYTPFYMMDFLTGQAKLNKLEKDADVYLKKFVSFYKGQNLVKDAYKRLSWFYLLEGDTIKFTIYQGLSRKYGAANSDEDKNAQRESEAGIYPDIILLKARLLFDGGYYAKAEETIKSHSTNFKSHYQQIEYYYRYARIMQESNKISKAIEWYNQTIKVAGNNNLYFAPNSCLQLGFIYEKLGFKELAKFHFEKVLTYKNYDYKSSVTQKAKAALSKLNGE